MFPIGIKKTTYWANIVADHNLLQYMRLKIHYPFAIHNRRFDVFLVTAIIKIVIDDINILWIFNDPWNKWNTNKIDFNRYDWLDIARFLQCIKSEMIGHMFTISKECIMSNKLYSFFFWHAKANVVDTIHVWIKCKLYELYCNHVRISNRLSYYF